MQQAKSIHNFEEKGPLLQRMLLDQHRSQVPGQSWQVQARQGWRQGSHWLLRRCRFFSSSGTGQIRAERNGPQETEISTFFAVY